MTDILFGNNNRTIIKKIANESIRAKRSRNFFVIFAVILTTVLFSTFFSVCGGMVDQVKQANQLQYGTAQAAVKFLTAEQYATLEASD